MNVTWTKLEECIVCGKSTDRLFDLPDFPLTDIYVDEPEDAIVDQVVNICTKCGHVHLTSLVDPNILYGKAYAFRTSIGGSVPVNDMLHEYIGNETFNRVVEIGCNDCYLLNTLRKRAPKLVGIDPVLIGREEEFSDDQLTAIGGFVEDVSIEEVPGTLFLSSHVMEHLPNPRVVLEVLHKASSEDDLFLFQFPGFDSLLQDSRFDQIYNHHIHYFSLYSFNYLLNDIGFEIVSYSVNPNYWGTLTVVFKKCKSPYSLLGSRPSSQKTRIKIKEFKNNMELINKSIQAHDSHKIIGYGAALQVPVLSYHLNNDFSTFDCIVDDDERKDGKYFLNLPVQIIHSSKVDLTDAVVFITAHNFSRYIIPKLTEMKPRRILLFNNGI
jgi:hypothetical protein